VHSALPWWVYGVQFRFIGVVRRMPKLTVLIVDNSWEFRHLLKRLLRSSPEIEIIGEAENGREALNLARQLNPDIVIMDVRMPRLNGLESTRLLKEEMPATDVIVLSLHDIEEYRKEALANGACSYIIKRNMVSELIPAIHETFHGKRLAL
jgi:DNA-binding NarL/FixJ family response regulator